MADKDFKVKNKLFVNGLSNNSGVILATNNNLDSHTTVPTQYGGTGTTTSPNAGQIPYSSSGTNYAPTDLSSLTISSSGGSTITAASASTKGLIIKGASSQTANLQEWQDSAGTAYTYIGNPITTGQGPSIPIVFSADGVGQIKWGNNTVWSIGLISGQTNVMYPYSNSRTALIIRGLASQTANLQEWQDSAGTVLAKVDASGIVTSKGIQISNGPTVTTGTNNLIIGDSNTGSSITAQSNNVMIGASAGIYNFGSNNTYIGVGRVISGGNGGQNVWIGSGAGASTHGYSGNILIGYQAGQSIAASNQLVIANSSTTTPLIGGDFSAKTLTFAGNVTITSQAAGTVATIIKGATSQTADLQQWQNSAGTVLAAVSNIGTIRSSIFANTTGGLTYIATNFDTSGIGIVAISAAQKGLIVRGAASQTANLQEWQDSAGTVLASISAAGNLTVQDLTVNGTTTTINSTTLTVDDKNIELASVASPTDTTANGAGITIKGATDKTFNWVQSTGAFTSSEPISTPALSVSGNSVSSNITLAAGKRYFVDTTSARTLTLPASPSLGDEIQIFDASGTAATNNITIARNSSKINGVTDDAIIDVNQSASTFVYTGATVGWRFD